MAIVYQVLDTTTKRKLALKQLTKERNEKQKGSAELFEHEYHVLSQLSHPRVIEVYDYGVENDTPYYTMELLDGGDLREISPLPWRQACSLLRDVCSALSLLHSRRKIHRDLTPRNVRCTKNGKAKLIDFGAMVPMGHCKYVVGTPPFTAPEVVNVLALDARTDLYSLGATAYYVLTRRHAYPARNFRELRDMWRLPPKPPSSIVAEIPRDLDSLVMSLINLDSMARPVNAAEVMERLSVIASLETDEQLLISNSYLSTPTLVGRDRDLLKVRKQIVRAYRGHGSTIIIEGASGVGRSRFLDACVLEGKLAGATVLRADAGDKHIGNWGIARTIVAQLIDGLPKLALSTVMPHISILGHVVPELIGKYEGYRQRSSFPPREGTWTRTPSAPRFRVDSKSVEQPREEKSVQKCLTPIDDRITAVPKAPSTGISHEADVEDPFLRVREDESQPWSTWTELWGKTNSLQPPAYPESSTVILEKIADPRELRPRVQTALRDWFLQISNQRVLMLAIDDVHRIDEPSAAFIALLSNHLSQNKLVIVATRESGASAVSTRAIKLLREAGIKINLRNLGFDNTEKLLGSVFGETPHRRIMANRLYTITKGNPNAIMQLAQHLIDRGSVYYQSGTWYLPSRFDPSDLPESLSDALSSRFKTLSDPARQLAQTLALSPDSQYSFEDCLFLTGTRELTHLIRILDELISSEILTKDRQNYSFSQQGWISVLTNPLDEEQKRANHLKLAELFIKNSRNEYIIAKHLLGAGQIERALDELVDRSEKTREIAVQNPGSYSELVLALPPSWYETTESAISACDRLKRPQRQHCVLRFGLVGLGAATGRFNLPHLFQHLEQLYRDSGLNDYQQLDALMEESARISRALELAQQRYDATPESQRYLPPIEAIRELAQIILVAISLLGVSYDYELLEALPSLKPFVPLSPALGVVEDNIQCTAYIISARHDKALRGYRELLERISQPDHAGLDEVIYRYSRLSVMYAIGAIESAMGIKSAIAWADRFDHDPFFQVNAWGIRMTNHMVQGDKEKAEYCRKRMELLHIQNSPSQFFEGTQIYLELLTYSRTDDLIGIKHCIPEIRRMQEKYRAWSLIYAFAQCEYQRIRGDYETARGQFEQTLESIEAGRHMVWPYLSFGFLRTLFALQRYQEVKDRANELIERGELVEIGYVLNYLKMQLALAEAELDETENAVRHAQEVIDAFEKLGLTGLNLGLAYETRARVAVIVEDKKVFTTYARLCAEQYRAGHNQALTIKYEKLVQDAAQAELTVSSEIEHAVDTVSSREQSVYDLVVGMMTQCRDRAERMRATLDLLSKSSNSSGGFLYTIKEGAPVLSANSCIYKPTKKLETTVRSYLSSEIAISSDNTVASSDSGSSSSAILDWTNEEGAVFHPLLLAHNSNEGFVLAGVAVLLVNPNRLFRFPGEEVVSVSRSLVETGDVEPIVTAL